MDDSGLVSFRPLDSIHELFVAKTSLGIIIVVQKDEIVCKCRHGSFFYQLFYYRPRSEGDNLYSLLLATGCHTVESVVSSLLKVLKVAWYFKKIDVFSAHIPIDAEC